MREQTKKIYDELLVRYPALSSCADGILSAYQTLEHCYQSGGRVYFCGNGGSAADCEHIVGELMKSFKKRRPLQAQFHERLLQGDEGELLVETLEGGLPAVSLCGHPALTSAFANDKNPALGFAQQLSVLAEQGDVLVTLSTSGNSQNCVYAALTAKAKQVKSVFLGGGKGGKLKTICDVSVIVPETETYKVQELHLPIYHCLCAMLEEEFFG